MISTICRASATRPLPPERPFEPEQRHHRGVDELLRRFFQRGPVDEDERPLVKGHRPHVPSGIRVYVVGDVHGRVDLLRSLQGAMENDRNQSGAHLDSFVVYVGDYVDRGFESRQVIDCLLQEPMTWCRSVYLLGNHEVWLRDFMRGEDVGPSWIAHGGDATLLSYDVRLDFQMDEKERLGRARLNLVRRMPPSHARFLASLEPAFSLGDYFFCHAGVRPTVTLERQTEKDLVWIREPFLGSTMDFGKIVVHGHTPVNEPEIRRNRICIDTGACWTGNLTCLVLEGSEYRFLSTGKRPA